jgi:L-fucose mutarotase
MLKNIDPLLTPELLQVMAAMGHGDELAVVDANFPADSVALRTGHGRVVPLAGTSMPEAVRAILTLLPLDDFVDTPVRRMAIDNSPDDLPEAQREVQAVIDHAAGRSWPTGTLARFDFYEAAGNSYAVVLTGERRYYGNVLIRKGAIPPEA